MILRTIARAAGKIGLGVGTFAVTLVLMPMPGAEFTSPPARPEAPSEAERLLIEHADECWQGHEAALAELPSAAIVRFTDGRVAYVTRPVLVDEAFAEVLSGIGYGDRVSDRLDPVALCL